MIRLSIHSRVNYVVAIFSDLQPPCYYLLRRKEKDSKINYTDNYVEIYIRPLALETRQRFKFPISISSSYLQRTSASNYSINRTTLDHLTSYLNTHLHHHHLILYNFIPRSQHNHQILPLIMKLIASIFIIFTLCLIVLAQGFELDPVIRRRGRARRRSRANSRPRDTSGSRGNRRPAGTHGNRANVSRREKIRRLDERSDKRKMRRCSKTSAQCHTIGHPYPESVRYCEDCERVCTGLSNGSGQIRKLRTKKARSAARRTSSRCTRRRSFIITVTCIKTLERCERNDSKATCHACVNVCAWTQVTKLKDREFRVHTMRTKCSQLVKTKSA